MLEEGNYSHGDKNPRWLESNDYRISNGDYETLKELILFKNRNKEYDRSEELLSMAKTWKKKAPTVFLKLEGIIHLRKDRKEEGKKLLQKYRNALTEQVEERTLFSNDELESGELALVILQFSLMPSHFLSSYMRILLLLHYLRKTMRWLLRWE